MPLDCVPKLINNDSACRDGRSAYMTVGKYSSLLDYKKDKVAEIVQNDDGFYDYVIRYELTPVQVDAPICSSIGIPYGETDTRTVNCTPEEWLEALQNAGCNYLYLYRIDEQFTSQYGGMFSEGPESQMMYTINYAGEGVCFSPVILEGEGQ